MLVILVAFVPIAIFAALIIVPANVRWQPPLTWRTDSRIQVQPSVVPIVSVGKTGVYASVRSSITMFDLNGHEGWTEQLGNPNNVTIATLNAGGDGLYVSGNNCTCSRNYVFVEKTDLNGGKIWVENFENLTITLTHLGASVGASGFYVAGLGMTPKGSSFAPLVMRHYDFAGAILWTRTLTTESSEGVGGTINVYADASGVYLSGSNPFSNATTSTQAFVSRIDANGSLLWTRFLDPPTYFCLCHPTGLSADPSGVYVGGNTERSFPGETAFSSGGGSFLRKYDPSGNVLWTVGSPLSAIGLMSSSGLSIYTDENGITQYDGSSGSRVWSFLTNGGVLGGASDDGFYAWDSTTGNLALLKYAPSASLVFFGINPPFSFLLVAILVGIVPIAIVVKKLRMRL